MRVYLDHNATTPLRAEVLDVMAPVLGEVFGNPSSTHQEGAAARRIVDRAREQVARAVGCEAADVTFTAGATEANNAVIQSLRSAETPWRRLITTAIEHPSVTEPAAALEREGIAVTWLGVDANGRLDLGELSGALAGAPALVSVIWANNETGVLQPMEPIAERVRAAGSWLHVDATQALGKTPVDLGAVGAHWLSCSAHKLNGPKGTGALVARDAPVLPPLLCGGPQERRARGGTENVAGIAGLGAACELATAELGARIEHYRGLRDRLWQGLAGKLPDLRWNAGDADPDGILPNTLSVEFAGAAGEMLLQALDLAGVAASAGAACHSGSVTPSHVLSAMGRTPEQARATLRLSVGWGNDEAQIDEVIGHLVELVPRVRQAVGA
ncbi:MAG: cysteine desulfurase family protein [Myxococcota bacterium]|nr:cysteine desulfurase family protein [Myxococcota bacterium]